MRRIILIVSFMLLSFSPNVEALYVNIENIGTVPLIALDFYGNILSPSGQVVQPYQILSSGAPGPTNIYFPPFDWNHQLAVGASLNTFAIPELTGTRFTVTGVDMSMPNGYTQFKPVYGTEVIPNVTTLDFVSTNPVIPVGARFSFFSGGQVAGLSVSSYFPLVIHKTLGKTFSFDYFWSMGFNPPPYQQGDMFDVLALQAGNGWQYIGQIDAYDESTGWQTAMFQVPSDLQGQEVDVRFVLTDYYPLTNPTVYLRNISGVPEPTTMLLLGLGLVGLTGVRRKFQK